MWKASWETWKMWLLASLAEVIDLAGTWLVVFTVLWCAWAAGSRLLGVPLPEGGFPPRVLEIVGGLLGGTWLQSQAARLKDATRPVEE
jgi:hypothetical protein